jgi:hypothetical protein
MYLNDSYCKLRIGEYLPDVFPVQNGLRQRDALLLLLFNFALECDIRNVHVNQEGRTEWKTSAPAICL